MPAVSESPSTLKDTFGPAQPVSYQWYNFVARLLKDPATFVEVSKLMQGYNAGAVQALMNVNGVIKWVTVNSNCA